MHFNAFEIKEIFLNTFCIMNYHNRYLIINAFRMYKITVQSKNSKICVLQNYLHLY